MNGSFQTETTTRKMVPIVICIAQRACRNCFLQVRRTTRKHQSTSVAITRSRGEAMVTCLSTCSTCPLQLRLRSTFGRCTGFLRMHPRSRFSKKPALLRKHGPRSATRSEVCFGLLFNSNSIVCNLVVLAVWWSSMKPFSPSRK